LNTIFLSPPFFPRLKIEEADSPKADSFLWFFGRPPFHRICSTSNFLCYKIGELLTIL
jgi:hypothetical protein